MSILSTLEVVAKGAAAGVAVVTALPVFGAVGVVTATGAAVGATCGALAVLADSLVKE